MHAIVKYTITSCEKGTPGQKTLNSIAKNLRGLKISLDKRMVQDHGCCSVCYDQLEIDRENKDTKILL